MLRKIIDEFLNREDRVKKYKEGVQLLKEAGFLELLRKFGYPDIIDGGNNANAMAVQAARSHGFQNAVSHLEYFLEMYAYDDKKKENVVPTFGAENIALKEKYLSPEDIEKLKRNRI